MLSALLNRPCTIIRRLPSTDIDDYGSEIPTEDTVSTTCELQQQQRSEPGLEGEQSDTKWLLILPPGTQITTADTVEVDGEEYEMVGAPWEARNPRTGLEHHVEASVQRTAGSEDAS